MRLGRFVTLLRLVLVVPPEHWVSEALAELPAQKSRPAQPEPPEPPVQQARPGPPAQWVPSAQMGPLEH